MQDYPQVAYSWLCIPPKLKAKRTVKSKGLNKKRIQTDCRKMKRSLVLLNSKVQKCHTLCQRYLQAKAPSKKAKINSALVDLHKEIEKLSKELNLCVEDAVEFSHENKAA